MITTVAPNTALADLDDALELLLRRELSGTGFEGVAIAFEAPDREWAKALTQPTLNLFLYDLRENRQRRAAAWEGGSEDGRRVETRPPLWLDASYTLTAFSRAVQDEHRLLSQALTALSSYPDLPEDVLGGPLAGACQQFGKLHTRVGDPGHDATPDFWTAVGGPYKLSFHYIVTVPFPSGSVLHRGPPVQVQRVSVGDRLTRRPDLEERSRVAGSVVERDGSGVAEVWVTLRDLGRVCESDPLGRFSFTGIPPGSHPVLARDRSGRETEAILEVPGELLVITLPPAAG
ncbi:MAG TPA: Pvc16 family protein [Solirubrobacteraceae bacterium]|nr:Pvc16 family protein [Solirubrobacteraceae bacterium]